MDISLFSSPNSNNNNNNHNHNHNKEEAAAANLFLHHHFFSSSSSSNHHNINQQQMMIKINGLQAPPPIDMQSSNYTRHVTSITSRSSGSSEPAAGGAEEAAGGAKWASRLLVECARAVADKDSTKMNHLLWMLNELASPYGDCEQKLASYFLQALFCKATDSGLRCYKTLTSVAEKSHSFDSARKLILKFQEVSPWTTFGHVASNGAILEALDGESKLHIIDISNTLCTQWPTLLEALATRNDDTPHLKLTVVVTSGLVMKSVMKEIGQRMEKFARLMGVPFEIHVISGLNHLGDLTKEDLGVQEDEAIAVNCIGALRRVEVAKRGDVIRMFQSLKPRVVTVVEEEANDLGMMTSSSSSTTSSSLVNNNNNNDDDDIDVDVDDDEFVKCFQECLRFYTLYFDMLEESFVPTSNERLMLERECSRSIVRVLGCDHRHHRPRRHKNNDQDNDDRDGGAGECERRERGIQWSERLKDAFSPVGFSDDVVDDVKALLKRYRAGWALLLPPQAAARGGGGGEDSSRTIDHQTGIYLTWKEEPVVWASIWKLNPHHLIG